MSEPDLLLMDEPSGLAPLVVRDPRILLELKAKAGILLIDRTTGISSSG
jgi:ABC-type branched-subunit amino acid transport system ATPase component